MGSANVIKKHLQQGLALEWLHALDVRRKTAVYKQYFSAGFRVRDDHRVLILRINAALGGSYFVVANIGQGAIMHRSQILQ